MASPQPNLHPRPQPGLAPAVATHPSDGRHAFIANGVHEFAGQYDVFLVDQWGVMHDGRAPFPGAVACLRTLVAAGKRVVVLSNSGKPGTVNAARLAAMGYGADCYTQLITSGDVVLALRASGRGPFAADLGQRCLLWSSDSDGSLLDRLNYLPAATVDGADFILLAGVSDSRPTTDYTAELRRALRWGLPLICANPDTVRFTHGKLTFSAGAVARIYEDMGGEVHYIGKPHAAMYDHCLKSLGDVDRRRVLAVGDSLSHDVLGGARAGIDTAFVTGGIHREDFADAENGRNQLEILGALCQDVGVRPLWVIPQLQW